MYLYLSEDLHLPVNSYTFELFDRILQNHFKVATGDLIHVLKYTDTGYWLQLDRLAKFLGVLECMESEFP